MLRKRGELGYILNRPTEPMYSQNLLGKARILVSYDNIPLYSLENLVDILESSCSEILSVKLLLKLPLSPPLSLL